MEHFIITENVEKDILDIVILGSFNPVIITPYWLAGKNLIRESDANNANVRIIHNEIADYDLEWATLNITQKKFRITCKQVPFFEITIDLIVGIFSILKETPITSFGFNHNKAISLKNKERLYEFGNKLSPLSNWSGFLNDPRLQRIDILESESKQKEEGSVTVTILSSVDLDIQYGVSININDHYNFSLKGGKKFLALYLKEYWPNSINIANNILFKLSESLKL